jgi:FcoT-like thioesterase domain
MTAAALQVRPDSNVYPFGTAVAGNCPKDGLTAKPSKPAARLISYLLPPSICDEPDRQAPIAISPDFVADILSPYKAHARYLKTAQIASFREKSSDDKGKGALAKGVGRFAISESCYIDNTGHFNAVEFNICYNQLTYCLLATCIDEQALKPFAGWSLADFSRRQLSSFLIARFFSSFHKPLAGGTFEGRVDITQVAVRRGTTFMKTTCQFFDDGGGRAEGGATIAIVDGAHA